MSLTAETLFRPYESTTQLSLEMPSDRQADLDAKQALVCLIIGGLWYLRNKQDIAAAPTATRALSLIGLGVAAVQFVFVVVILLVHSIVS